MRLECDEDPAACALPFPNSDHIRKCRASRPWQKDNGTIIDQKRYQSDNESLCRLDSSIVVPKTVYSLTNYSATYRLAPSFQMLLWLYAIPLVNPTAFISLFVLNTCSMHGENEAIPEGISFLNALYTCGIATHGAGISKNTASAQPSLSSQNPSLPTFLCEILMGHPMHRGWNRTQEPHASGES